MNKKILFSPIGGTDPITNKHDGSLLHIVRPVSYTHLDVYKRQNQDFYWNGGI